MSAELIVQVLDGAERPARAFNDHTGPMLLHLVVAVHERPFDRVPYCPGSPFDLSRFLTKMADQARRTHVTAEADAAPWGQVSQTPATADGLTDRGRIAPGLRTDLIFIDWPKGHASQRIWVAGRGSCSALPAEPHTAAVPEPAH